MNPLGDNLLPLLILALGAAMAVGNLLALVRPPENPKGEDDLEKAPVARSVIYIVLGTVASLWSIVTMLSG